MARRMAVVVVGEEGRRLRTAVAVGLVMSMRAWGQSTGLPGNKGVHCILFEGLRSSSHHILLKLVLEGDHRCFADGALSAVAAGNQLEVANRSD